jgi:hypothetical protein
MKKGRLSIALIAGRKGGKPRMGKKPTEATDRRETDVEKEK